MKIMRKNFVTSRASRRTIPRVCEMIVACKHSNSHTKDYSGQLPVLTNFLSVYTFWKKYIVAKIIGGL